MLHFVFSLIVVDACLQGSTYYGHMVHGCVPMFCIYMMSSWCGLFVKPLNLYMNYVLQAQNYRLLPKFRPPYFE